MNRIEPHIRWMIRRDMQEVLDIENQCFDNPWTEEDFIRCLRQMNCIGLVAEANDLVLGYAIYELHKTRLHILNLAVHPDYRRRRIGQAIFEELEGKLSCDRRNRLLLEVRETNLDAQVFLRDMRFKAVRVLREFYDDTDEDAYLMEYRVSKRKAVPRG